MEKYYNKLEVAISENEALYNEEVPFHPAIQYPEYPFNELSKTKNPAYDGVRKSFFSLGLDLSNYGKSNWNPLCEIVKPGDNVVIKPNFVLSRHYEGGDLFSIITHPSVLRAVVDFVYIALKGKGTITIADAPQMDCNFNELLSSTQIESVRSFYKSKCNFSVNIFDLRNFWLDNEKTNETIASTAKRVQLPGDPKGSVLADIGKKSQFFKHPNLDKIYGADYDRNETKKYHHDDVHQYIVSKTILDADVLISVPKLKVHKKVGVTLNAKGLVGINTNKNCLVHFTLGTPENGGDQFPNKLLSLKEKILIFSQRKLFDLLLSRKNSFFDSIYNFIYKTYRKLIRPWYGNVKKEKLLLDAGNWQGNDSAWRMVADLMHIAFFADKNGNIKDFPQRKIFSVVDGIIAGENNGPLTPDSKFAGIIVAGYHPLAVDLVSTSLMGFDYTKIKSINNLLSEPYGFKIEDVNISGEGKYNNILKIPGDYLNFKPHPGWQGIKNRK